MQQAVRVVRFVVAIIVIAGLSPMRLTGQAPASAPPPTPAQALVYPPTDSAADIAAALRSAKQDGKHVLLDFGADWCPDCRVLGKLFEDASVAPVAEASFHVVHIDVGRRDKNSELVTKYDATSGDWIPAVVVLGPDGAPIARTDDKVRLTRRTSAEELLVLLRQWAPKRAWLELGSFTERGVHVGVGLDRDRSGGVWLTARFTPQSPDVHLYATELAEQGIDGLGRPTRLALIDATGITTKGPVVADRAIEWDRIEALKTALPIYPTGQVTLRQAVTLDRSPSGQRATVSISYMGCGSNGCLPPVSDRRLSLVVPAQH